MTDDRSHEAERELYELAQSLPREEEPPASAWQEIHARITDDARLRASTAGVPLLRTWQRPKLLAAAAVLLVVGSSGVTALLVRGGSAFQSPASVEQATTGPSGPLTFAEFSERENDYLQHVNTLLAALEDESSGLAPETIATIRANLLVIDAAIVEARRALASDPANHRLVEILASTYEKKLDLLRRTTAMARSG